MERPRHIDHAARYGGGGAVIDLDIDKVDLSQRPFRLWARGTEYRGQSLIVWAIAEGRSAARAIDEYLMGESQLPAPLE